MFSIEFYKDNTFSYNYRTIEDKIDKKLYLVAEKNDEFIIRMNDINKTRKSFGTTLILDEKEIPWIKTFKTVGHYFGFKHGDGIYTKFQFDYPDVGTSILDCDLEYYSNFKKAGKIEIKFYNAITIETKKKFKNFKSKIDFKSSYIPEDKKFYQTPLCIKEGERYSIEIRDDYNFYDIPNYEEEIDSVEVYYSDFFGLQVRGIINLNNFEHLKYIPAKDSSFETFIKALETLVKQQDGQIDLSDVERQFNCFCKSKLSNYIPSVEHLDRFLKERQSLLCIKGEGDVKILTLKSLNLSKVQIDIKEKKDKYSGIPLYYMVPSKKKDYLTSKLNDSRSNNNDIETIDLTLD